MNNANTQLECLIELTKKEQAVQVSEEELTNMFSLRALVSLGYAIDQLQVLEHTDGTITLKCNSNYSRFRPGDRLRFINEHNKKFNGTLIRADENGLVLHVRVSDKLQLDSLDKWIAVEQTIDLSNAIISTLENLMPGAPGWGFVKRLLSDTPAYYPEPRLNEAPFPEKLYEEIVGESGQELDASQREAFIICCEAPSLYGVQGPPGTGKTRLLAFIVEALIRREQQVLLLAFTHQAVNNALSTIHEAFPWRPVVKFGDQMRDEALSDDIKIISKPDKLPVSRKDYVIGMTYMSAMHRLMLRDKKLLNPNVLVIDEAGQLPLTQGICAGLTGAGSILLFGDDQQMPPVFSGDVDEEPMAISTFSQLRKTQPNAISTLKISYRLNDELCEAIGKTFYPSGNESSIFPSEKSRKRRIDPKFAKNAASQIAKDVLGNNSLIWVNVPGRNAIQYNSKEAEITADIVSTCLNSGLPSDRIAVITPFRRQAAHIRNMLLEKLDNPDNCPIIDTVERVQGKTVDIAVISICASEPDYVANIAKFLFSPNRMNVAVSRARYKAIVLSSPDIFNVIPKDYTGIIGRNKCYELLQIATKYMHS